MIHEAQGAGLGAQDAHGSQSRQDEAVSRMAPDGQFYTREEFLEFYGDDVEWNAAQDGPPPLVDRSNASTQGQESVMGANQKTSGFGHHNNQSDPNVLFN